MADINFAKAEATAAAGDAGREDGAAPAGGGPPLRWDIIELLFFAYRDFVGDADHVLEAFGFGRAHHRVVTAKGEALIAKLAGLQTDRITRAMSGLDASDAAAVSQFLRGMIDREDSDKVLERLLDHHRPEARDQ
jgi:hypothetical protein